MMRSREFEMHESRLRYEAPLDPEPSLRPWAACAVKVLSFLWWAGVLVALTGTVKGW